MAISRPSNDFLVVPAELRRLREYPIHMPNPRFRTSLLVFALLAGCGTGTYSITMPISGGDTVPLELNHGGIAPAENDDFKINAARLAFDPRSKTANFDFGFTVKRGTAPLRVVVDDVSDDAPATLYQTDKVTLDNGNWKVKMPSFTPDQKNTKWLFEIESSIRVYRFTFVTPDGRSEIMYQGFNYPAFLKELIRQQLNPNPSATPAAAP